MVPSSIFFPKISLESLRDLCKDLGVATDGAKENFTERVLNSIVSKEVPNSSRGEFEPIVEERALDNELFKRIFSFLTSFELSIGLSINVRGVSLS